MNAVPAGWYADPEHPARRRYWDGARWTEHVQEPPAQPAGWYPDPGVEGQLRYWDGTAWTDHVELIPLFDGEVPLPIGIRGKKQHLRVTTEGLHWGDLYIGWDEVSFFTQLVNVQTGAEVQYTIRLVHGDLETALLFGYGTRPDRASRQAYAVIIDQLRRTLGTRVIGGLLEMVDRREPIRTAGLIFSPDGFGKEETGELVPWSQFAGLEVNNYEGIWIRLFRTKGDKRKPAARIKVTQLHSWAIPPVVEAHARRYAAGGR
ncbi:DUF2510 domain-containing protein [Nocardioides immobilis]|uniref:DUF2510 domain-containing protein n=1 Tax=Nocardioides immobilis TaxID=2049295 RepID=UPI001C71223A|nr:DUF2510 domain-containing protein [Nocardioides immobilis]